MRLMLIVALAIGVHGSVGKAAPQQSRSPLFPRATLAITGDADSVIVRLLHPDGEVCTLGGGGPEGIEPRCGFAYVFVYVDDPPEFDQGWYLEVDEDGLAQPLSIAFEAIGSSKVGVDAYWEGDRGITCAGKDSLQLHRGEHAGWRVVWSKKADRDTCWVHLRRYRPDSVGLGKMGDSELQRAK